MKSLQASKIIPAAQGQNKPMLIQSNLKHNTTIAQRLPQNQPPQDPQPPQESFQPSRPYGEALVKGAVYGGVGALLGAGMAQGGVGGFVCGALAGATVGGMTIARLGDGKGAEGLVYAAAGLAGGAIAGGVAGALGVPHGALIGGASLGLLKAGSVLSDR